MAKAMVAGSVSVAHQRCTVLVNYECVTVTWLDGHKYVGEFEGGVQHGHGTCELSSATAEG